MNILISSLGTNAVIVEEAVGVFNYSDDNDFYANLKSFEKVQKLRNKPELQDCSVDEVWLLATDKPHVDSENGCHKKSTLEEFASLKSTAKVFGVRYRMFVLKGIKDIVDEKGARAFHDMALRVVEYAHQRKGNDGKVFVSLACGRKTMSADLQDAAFCFGADMVFHILGDNKNEALPVALGSVQRNEVFHITCHFEDSEIVYVECSDSTLGLVEEQKQQSQFYYTTFYLQQSDRSNFHVLYTLPPSKITKLKNEFIGVDQSKAKEDLEFIHRLPKTDLHCHLGGVLSPSEMIEVASCYSVQIDQERKTNGRYSAWYDILQSVDCINERQRNWKEWRSTTAKELDVCEGLVVAPFLLKFKGHDDLLERLIFGEYLDDKSFLHVGINKYESLGDLQGTALLCNKDALQKTVQILLDNCWKENVAYLEIRCSPDNYASEGFPLNSVVKAIVEILKQYPEIKTSLIVIASRHRDLLKTKECIRNTLQLKGQDWFDKYFRGFDLAGDEKKRKATDMRDDFLNIMKDCYNITIHAGETDDVESIWSAVYDLNAERIGHGLKLLHNKELLNKFLERSIGIEMCPSSNFQIVGFRDNYFPAETEQYETYPLKNYLSCGLNVSVNTDDPGISMTNISKEILKAARMTSGGLSKWEILQLICNGFRTAFYPYQQKQQLIKDVENKLSKLIIEGVF